MGSAEIKLVLVVPAHNEAVVLERSIRTLHQILTRFSPQPWRLVIAENGSSDATKEIAKRLASELASVEFHLSDAAGKGRAVMDAWRAYDALWYGFIDADLSVDLNDALPKVVRAFEHGADLVVASRHLALSVVDRPLYRRMISHVYHTLIGILVGTKLTDLACGCKFVTRRVVDKLLPIVENNQWFFDSELLLRAEDAGLPVAEIPIIWQERRYPDRPSSLPIMSVSWQYLKQLLRLRSRLKDYRQ